ncbi:MAG TPA: hypothetical protein VNV39_07190 [Stellaceae bacterium]|nr:hypothetical protein [Stellaceae bacterium]
MRALACAIWVGPKSSASPPLWILREFAVIEVPIWPGITTEHLTCGALILRSAISASVKPLTANFAALYAVCGMRGPTDAQKPLTLLVLTMWPSSAFSSIGRRARVQL